MTKQKTFWIWFALFIFGSVSLNQSLANNSYQNIPSRINKQKSHVAAEAPTGFTRVTDQAYTLQCWAIAIASQMDFEASRIAGQPLKTSPKYLVYVKTLDEVVTKIVSGNFAKHMGNICEKCKDKPIYYEQGGTLQDAVEVVRRFGMVPESAYPDFIENDDHLFIALNSLIEKYASSPRMPRDRAGVMVNVANLLNRHLGRPPQDFLVGGNSFTSQKFAEIFLPSWHSAKAIELEFQAGSKKSKSFFRAYDDSKFTNYITNDRADIIKVLSESLSLGRPVLVSTWYLDDAFDKSEIGFKINGTKPPRKFDDNGPDALGHYMLALSGQNDTEGKLNRVFVRNTFGILREDGFGYQWMERDYFPYISGVEIPSDLVERFANEGLLVDQPLKGDQKNPDQRR
jgi:hypothetical protein